MDAKTYVKNVLITEARDLTSVMERLQDPRNVRLLHASAGLSSEIAELFELSEDSWNGADTKIDRVNLMEECGDLLWYIGIACDALDCTEEVTSQKSEYGIKGNFMRHDDDLNDCLYKAAARLANRSGEFADLAIKKAVFYGKPFNALPLVSLLTDMHLSIELLLQQAGYELTDARERNIAKLKARYGEKFSEAAALERNLENERAILEKK